MHNAPHAATVTPDEIRNLIIASGDPDGELYLLANQEGGLEAFSANERLTNEVFFSKHGKFYSKIPSADPGAESLPDGLLIKLSDITKSAWHNNFTGYLD